MNTTAAHLGWVKFVYLVCSSFFVTLGIAVHVRKTVTDKDKHADFN